MDWEDVNKQAFVTAVQTVVLADGKSPSEALRIVGLALSLKRADIPSNCLKAVVPFVDWADGDADRPEWVPEWMNVGVIGPVP